MPKFALSQHLIVHRQVQPQSLPSVDLDSFEHPNRDSRGFLTIPPSYYALRLHICALPHSNVIRDHPYLQTRHTHHVHHWPPQRDKGLGRHIGGRNTILLP